MTNPEEYLRQFATETAKRQKAAAQAAQEAAQKQKELLEAAQGQAREVGDLTRYIVSRLVEAGIPPDLKLYKDKVIQQQRGIFRRPHQQSVRTQIDEGWVTFEKPGHESSSSDGDSGKSGNWTSSYWVPASGRCLLPDGRLAYYDTRQDDAARLQSVTDFSAGELPNNELWSIARENFEDPSTLIPWVQKELGQFALSKGIA